MGSFQQISIGVICLIAAFAFGNYVNNNPPADHPLDTTVQNDSENSIGNVQSRIAGTDLEIIPKQPAPIRTMRSPLQQRFKVPLANSSIVAPKFDSPAVNSVTLPPPSQLRVEKSNEPLNQVAADSGLEQPRMAKLNDIPDFSDIVSEFRNTQIELPPLGKMPVHANPKTNQTANVIPFAVRKPASNALANGDAPHSASATRGKQPSFEADDFAPQLNDRFLNSEPVNVKHESNQVLSRHKLPENSNSDSIDPIEQPKLARIQGQPASTTTPSNHGASVLELNNRVLASQNVVATGNRVRSKIPFGLNDEGKSQLVAIKSRASSQLESDSTKFVDHVIQPGESLQSISKRYFGKPDFYLDIYLANRGKLQNPVDTPDGIAIRIPIY